MKARLTVEARTRLIKECAEMLEWLVAGSPPWSWEVEEDAEIRARRRHDDVGPYEEPCRR